MIFDEDLPDWIDKALNKKNKEQLIEVMYEALDIMQGYNGHSRVYCVAVGLGYEPIENDDGSTSFKPPKKSKRADPTPPVFKERFDLEFKRITDEISNRRDELRQLCERATETLDSLDCAVEEFDVAEDHMKAGIERMSETL